MSNNQSIKNYAGKIIIIAFLFSLLYAITRYHVLGPIPWSSFPMYILNKAISLAAFIIITFNFTIGPFKNLGVSLSDGWMNARRALGMTGFLLVLIHALISFMLFKPEIYSQFFEASGNLTLIGGLSMLGGVLGFVVLWGYNLSFQTHLNEDKAFISFITSRKFLLIALLLGMFHLLFMGYEGWINPSKWHGGLPPISLIAFTFSAIGYIINLVGRK